jgi:hypothetical protein
LIGLPSSRHEEKVITFLLIFYSDDGIEEAGYLRTKTNGGDNHTWHTLLQLGMQAAWIVCLEQLFPCICHSRGKIGSGMPSAVSFRRLIEESKCLIAVDGKFQCDQRPYET